MRPALSCLALLALHAGCSYAPIRSTDAGPRRDVGTTERDASVASDDASPGEDAARPLDSAIAPDATTPPDDSLWVLGYYPGYQRDLLPPDEVDYASMTHLVTFSVLPRTDGTLDTSLFIDPTSGPALARELATRAHAAGIEALLTVGGAGTHDGFVSATSPARRAGFVAEIVRITREWGYDGVDLDWEPILESDQPLLTALVDELRAADPELLITIPIGWANANTEPVADAYYAELASRVDRLSIMSYGMTGPWDGWTAWHSSALDGESGSAPTSVDQSVSAYRAAGVPAERLGVGVGFYGQCWRGVTMPGQSVAGATLVADDNVMRYSHIASAYLDVPSARHWDASASVPYLSFASAHGPEGCTYVSYEDAESIAAKVAYARERGLGALIVWTINQGHLDDGSDPLLDAIRDAR